MPVMDGFEASREIKKDHGEIQIAALTAYASQAFEERCYDAGMDYFLTKPVNQEKLQCLLTDLRLIKA